MHPELVEGAHFLVWIRTGSAAGPRRARLGRNQRGEILRIGPGAEGRLAESEREIGEAASARGGF